MFLDQLSINLKIVPEYPDLLEETTELKLQLVQRNENLALQHEIKTSLDRQLGILQETLSQRDMDISVVTNEREGLLKI